MVTMEKLNWTVKKIFSSEKCQMPQNLTSDPIKPPVFFLPNILCVHIHKLGTTVRKSTTESDLQNLQNRDQCRSEQASRPFVIQRRDIRERSHGFCLVASLVHACDGYRGMRKINFYTKCSKLKGTTWTLNALQPLLYSPIFKVVWWSTLVVKPTVTTKFVSVSVLPWA